MNNNVVYKKFILDKNTHLQQNNAFIFATNSSITFTAIEYFSNNRNIVRCSSEASSYQISTQRLSVYDTISLKIGIFINNKGRLSQIYTR